MKAKGVMYQIPYAGLKSLKTIDSLLTKKQRKKKSSCIAKGHGMKLLLSTPQLKKLQQSRKKSHVGDLYLPSLPS